MSLSRATARARMRSVVFGAMPIDPPLIVIQGEVDSAMADRVQALLDRPMMAGDLPVVINSPGGSPLASARIYNLLRAHHGRICTRAMSVCASAAIEILLAGDVREARIDTKFLLHNVEIRPALTDPDGSAVRWTSAEHKRTAKLLETVDSGLADVYALRTGKPAAIFRSEMATEAGISAEQARALGLIHRVL